MRKEKIRHPIDGAKIITGKDGKLEIRTTYKKETPASELDRINAAFIKEEEYDILN